MSFNPQRSARPQRTPPSSPSATPEENWAVRYAKANPIKVGSAIATFYGLFIIFGFHFHIDYAPVFDFKAFASLIFSAAYTATLVIVALSVGLFLPCYFIAAFCLGDKGYQADTPVFARIASCFFIAFVAFEVLFVLVFWLASKDWSISWVFLIFPITYAVFLAWATPWAEFVDAVRTGRRLGRQELGWWKWQKSRVLAFAQQLPESYKGKLQLSFALVSVCLLQFFTIEVFVLMSRESPYLQGETPSWDKFLHAIFMGGLIINLVGAYLVNAWCNPVSAGKHRVFSAMMVFMTPVLVSFFVGEPSLVFSMTAMQTKIGGFRAAEITLTDQGCSIIAGIDRSLCVKAGDGTNKLCNVHVMSRIGTETYLLLSYPQKTSGDKNDQSRSAFGEQSNATRAAKIKELSLGLQEVYLPTKDIIGLKLDTSVRKFTKAAMQTELGKVTSVCSARVEPAVTDEKNTQQPVVTTFGESQLFEFDHYVLTEHGKHTLDEFTRKLIDRKMKNVAIDVVGHADQIGPSYHNLSLSQLRAVTVASFLQARMDGKVQGVRIGWTGAGSAQSTIPEDHCPVSMKQSQRISCLAQNRRVEIKVVGSS